MKHLIDQGENVLDDLVLPGLPLVEIFRESDEASMFGFQLLLQRARGQGEFGERLVLLVELFAKSGHVGRGGRGLVLSGEDGVGGRL